VVLNKINQIRKIEPRRTSNSPWLIHKFYRKTFMINAVISYTATPPTEINKRHKITATRNNVITLTP
jgi:hypothetical protein